MAQTVIPLILFLIPLAYSPGPGNLFFAANGARFGFRATIPANAGYHLATWVVTAGIGLGFVSAVDRHPWAFDLLKICGALYVGHLAWTLARVGALDQQARSRPAGVLDGSLLLILNPKAYVIIALMFTQFLGRDNTSTSRILAITTVFTLNNLLAFSIWILLGDRIGKRFRDPDSAQLMNGLFGLMLATVAVWMLLQ